MWYGPDFASLLYFLCNCVINLKVLVFVCKTVENTVIVKTFQRKICHQKSHYSPSLFVFEIVSKNICPVPS